MRPISRRRPNAIRICWRINRRCWSRWGSARTDTSPLSIRASATSAIRATCASSSSTRLAGSQQVNDGCFERVDDVPRRALSLTIPFFMRTPHAVVTVPGAAKAIAVRAALEGPISPRCPASILRQHASAAIFLDLDSSALLAPE